jgi:DnaJ-class molecular chaperone
MLDRHYAGNNKSFPDIVQEEKMRCENCNGIGIVNLYEKTGENISTDCHLCNGTGQISHPVEEQSQFNDWFREVEDEDI